MFYMLQLQQDITKIKLDDKITTKIDFNDSNKNSGKYRVKIIYIKRSKVGGH